MGDLSVVAQRAKSEVGGERFFFSVHPDYSITHPEPASVHPELVEGCVPSLSKGRRTIEGAIPLPLALTPAPSSPLASPGYRRRMVLGACCFCFASMTACESSQLDIEQLIAGFQEQYRTFEQDCAQLRTQTAIKLLKRLQIESKNIINKISAPTLKPFIAFKPTSISSVDALLKINNCLLPALDFCDDAQAINEDYRVLKRIARTISELYEHLTRLYKDTIKTALEQSDDPKALERLLDLV